jgi:hypothetical protein
MKMLNPDLQSLNPGFRFRRCRLIALAAAVSLALGCAGEKGSSDVDRKQASEPGVARSEVERGPVRVVVEVEPAAARLSDEPTLTLSIDYLRGVEVRKPPFGEAIGEFLIRDFHEPLPKPSGDREILKQVYTLEPTTTGKLVIAPISVTFTDVRPDGDGKEHTVETEALTVEVASVVESEIPSLDDLRPAAGPVELPESGGGGWWIAAGVAAIAIALAAVWLVRKRRRREIEEKPLSPQELAYLELEQLIADDLAARDVKLFYVALTGVVRRYIERTTGVRAAEQTTEEFLRQIGSRPVFSAEESRRLQSLLESADLVKFAACVPCREDVEESFQRAKVFIGLESVEVAA